jgi:septal ring-binding cell division protein DamX
MRSLYLAVATLLVFGVGSALAAEFYVAQDTAPKKCKIVKTKPDGKTMRMIGTSSYATKEEARAAIKAAAECQKPSGK